MYGILWDNEPNFFYWASKIVETYPHGGASYRYGRIRRDTLDTSHVWV